MRRIRCPAQCDKGRIYYWGTETCRSCGGSGRNNTSDLRHETCRTCNGKGFVQKNPTICNICEIGRAHV